MTRAWFNWSVIFQMALCASISLAENHSSEEIRKPRPVADSSKAIRKFVNLSGHIEFKDDGSGNKVPFLVTRENWKKAYYRLEKDTHSDLPELDTVEQGQNWKIYGYETKKQPNVLIVSSMNHLKEWYATEIGPANAQAKQTGKPRPKSMAFQTLFGSKDPDSITLHMDDFTSLNFKVTSIERGNFSVGGKKHIVLSCEEIRPEGQEPGKKLVVQMLDVLEVSPMDKPPITSESFNVPLMSLEIQEGKEEPSIYLTVGSKTKR